MLFGTDTAARVSHIRAMNWVLQFDCLEDANSEQIGLPSRWWSFINFASLGRKKDSAASSWEESACKGSKNQSRKTYRHIGNQKKLESFSAQDQQLDERALKGALFLTYVFIPDGR